MCVLAKPIRSRVTRSGPLQRPSASCWCSHLWVCTRPLVPSLCWMLTASLWEGWGEGCSSSSCPSWACLRAGGASVPLPSCSRCLHRDRASWRGRIPSRLSPAACSQPGVSAASASCSVTQVGAWQLEVALRVNGAACFPSTSRPLRRTQGRPGPLLHSSHRCSLDASSGSAPELSVKVTPQAGPCLSCAEWRGPPWWLYY